MTISLRQWVAKKARLGGFLKRRDVLVFALTRSLWTTVAAVCLNYCVYALIKYFGLFVVPVPENAAGDALVTACVAGPIAFLAYFIVGSAIHDLALSRNEFERLSRTDSLTGLLNRRAFQEVISALTSPYVLVIVDIDRFKSINDTFGHAAGDRILVAVSDILRDAMGSRGTVSRLGGEEFGIVLPCDDSKTALELVDQFRRAVADNGIEVDGAHIKVTVSAGVSESDDNRSFSVLLSLADKALYLAKASGRNRVVHADRLADVLAPGFENERRNAG